VTRPRSLLAAACVLVLVLAGCGSGSHSKRSTSGTPRRASAQPPTTTTARRVEHTTAALLAAAYARFLSGAGATGGLPDTTPGVRALAGRVGAIPAARRRGTLLMTGLRPAAGAADRYLVTARDQAHTFYAQITLAERHGRWLVVALTPPDVVQALAPPGPPAPAPPPGSGSAEDAARLFLGRYLPWLYGHAPLRTITAATSRLLASLKTHPPRVPPTIQSLRPKVAAIAMQRRGRSWQALSNINHGRETYELVLTVAQTRGRWLVSNVSSPGR
jgi:hypothetical protein